MELLVGVGDIDGGVTVVVPAGLPVELPLRPPGLVVLEDRAHPGDEHEQNGHEEDRRENDSDHVEDGHGDSFHRGSILSSALFANAITETPM